MQIPRRKSEEFKRLKNEGPIHLTQEGLDQLKQKLERIKKSLPELIAETQRAAAYGDRSENAEYKLAKGSLRRANFQILDIEEQLRKIIVINSGPNTSGIIQIGATVVLEVNGSTGSPQDGSTHSINSGQAGSPQADSRKTFQIVGPKETNPTQGRISYLSPIGAALMNHKKGDVIIIQTPNGSKKYTILEIK